MAVEQVLFSARSSTPIAQWCAFAGEHSPYLRTLIERQSQIVEALHQTAPETIAEAVNARISDAAAQAEPDILHRILRVAKADIHLLTALMDISGVWDLETTTRCLSDFADAALQASLLGAARSVIGDADDNLTSHLADNPDAGPLPGLFIVAMGKYGAQELNYSSDVDFTVFFDPHIAQSWLGKDPSRITRRLIRRMVHAMEAVTEDGYVFRTDLRLRPDPGSTNPAVSIPGAHIYYESVGQNWERAARVPAMPYRLWPKRDI